MERWLKAAFLGLVMGFLLHWFSQPPEESQDFTLLFHQLDENGDGVLSLTEFLALQPPDNQGNGVVAIRSLFTPLQTETMDKDLQEASLSLKGLLDWQKPFQNQVTLSRDDLNALLPPRGIQVGGVWDMVEPSTEELTSDPSKVYSPVPPSKKTAEYTLYRVLSMFHPNVFLQTRFLPRGTVATLMAHNAEFLDIVFRCHAEFQLNHAPLLPFWFTPAQFVGRLIIARNASTVIHFSMAVPTDRKLNVDMEWHNKMDENMEVDIGFLPQMKAEKSRENIANLVQLVWEDEMSFSSAQDLLDKTMFPFKEVTYYRVEKAIKLSLEHQLLLHCIVLWGSLDDQSC